MLVYDTNDCICEGVSFNMLSFLKYTSLSTIGPNSSNPLQKFLYAIVINMSQIF